MSEIRFDVPQIHRSYGDETSISSLIRKTEEAVEPATPGFVVLRLIHCTTASPDTGLKALLCTAPVKYHSNNTSLNYHGRGLQSFLNLKGMFLLFQVYRNFANLFSKLSVSTSCKLISKFQQKCRVKRLD